MGQWARRRSKKVTDYKTRRPIMKVKSNLKAGWGNYQGNGI